MFCLQQSTYPSHVLLQLQVCPPRSILLQLLLLCPLLLLRPLQQCIQSSLLQLFMHICCEYYSRGDELQCVLATQVLCSHLLQSSLGLAWLLRKEVELNNSWGWSIRANGAPPPQPQPAPTCLLLFFYFQPIRLWISLTLA